jgi:hypothetical protein
MASDIGSYFADKAACIRRIFFAFWAHPENKKYIPKQHSWKYQNSWFNLS